MKSKKEVTIYTDGACKGNPGRGGWGAVLFYQEKEKHIYGGEDNTTNNRMEILAAIKSLESLRHKCNVTLVTDSQYVRLGISQWLAKWKLNNWRTSAKKAVKNVDLWQRLDAVCAQHEIKWQWVKGHSGVPQNELADALANKGIYTDIKLST